MLKEISLSRDGAIKLNKGNTELYFGDLEDNIKSLIPGEWIYLKNTKKNIFYLGYANPLVSNSTTCVHVFEQLKEKINSEEEYLFQKIQSALDKRNLFEGYEDNARLIYGDSDGVPGLLVDSYKNTIFIQINNAGIDRFRDQVKEFLQQKFIDKKVYTLDNEKYRQREMLPIYENENVEEDIEVYENGLRFMVSKNRIQKIGYYYDHRENRARLSNLIGKLKEKPEKALDLFSYVGSWGLNILNAGCGHVTFVDQGDFAEDVENNLVINKFNGKGIFVRDNVFDFVKAQVSDGAKFDLICSDPPAFCKSKKEAKKAYEGYLKLHKDLFKLLDEKSIFVACSCTYYINLEDFEKNVNEAARLTGRKIQLLDVGLQGYDHPTVSMFSKNTYLKYFVYLVE